MGIKIDFIQKGIKIILLELIRFQEISIPPRIENGNKNNIPKIM